MAILRIVPIEEVKALEDEKYCKHCNSFKGPIEVFFYRNRSMSDGWSHRCKPCEAERHAIYHRKNPEKLGNAAKQWRINNPERFREYQNRYAREARERAGKGK